MTKRRVEGPQRGGHRDEITRSRVRMMLFFFFFCFFRAPPVAYGSSQARGRVGAAAASLCTAIAMPDLSYVFDLHHSSQLLQTLNTLSEARE